MSSEKNYNEIPLHELELIAYRLQIDYNPPLTEDQRKKVVKEILRLKDSWKDMDFDAIRQKRKENMTYNNDVTYAMQKDVYLVSRQQLVIISTSVMGNEIGKIYHAFDRFDDVDYILKEKQNVFTQKPLTQLQMSILERSCSKKNPYPRIFVEELPEELKREFGMDEETPLFKHKKRSEKSVVDPDVFRKQAKKLGKNLSVFYPYENLVERIITGCQRKDINILLSHRPIYTKINETNYDLFLKKTFRYLNWYLEEFKRDQRLEEYESLIHAIRQFVIVVEKKISISDLHTYLRESGEEITDIHFNPQNLNISYFPGSRVIMQTLELDDDGNIHGVMVKYNGNGTVSERTNYRRNLRHGSHIVYKYALGFIPGSHSFLYKKIEVTYNNDILEGKVIKEDFKKSTIVEGQNKQGHKDGVWITKYSIHPYTKLESITYVMGKKNGECTDFCPDTGFPTIIGNYKDDVKTGRWSIYHTNGKLKSVCNMVNGEIEGEERNYREDSTLESVVRYKKGVRHGRTDYFDSKGFKIISFVDYSEGVQSEVVLERYPNGKPQQVLKYDINNRETIHFFNEEGGMISYGDTHPQQDGKMYKSYYYEDGQTVKEVICTVGEKIVEHIYYYPTGEVMFNYSNNFLVINDENGDYVARGNAEGVKMEEGKKPLGFGRWGTWERRDNERGITWRGKYDSNERTGIWSKTNLEGFIVTYFYYENGELKKSVKVPFEHNQTVDGKKVGKWVRYDYRKKKFILIEEGRYCLDRKVGIWKYTLTEDKFTRSEKLAKEMNFKDGDLPVAEVSYDIADEIGFARINNPPEIMMNHFVPKSVKITSNVFICGILNQESRLTGFWSMFTIGKFYISSRSFADGNVNGPIVYDECPIQVPFPYKMRKSIKDDELLEIKRKNGLDIHTTRLKSDLLSFRLELVDRGFTDFSLIGEDNGVVTSKIKEKKKKRK